MTARTDIGFTTREVDGVMVVELDDGKVNAFTRSKFEGLEDVIVAAAAATQPVVVAGRQGFFSAGLDLGVVRGGEAAEVKALSVAGDRLFLTMTNAPIPIVAACTGHALAAGAVILMCSDVRIGISGSYGIGLVEVAAGIALPVSIFELAERRLARQYMLRATVLAERWEPAAAVDVGFLDSVVDEDVVGAAVQAAVALAALPAEAFANSKRTFATGEGS